MPGVQKSPGLYIYIYIYIYIYVCVYVCECVCVCVFIHMILCDLFIACSSHYISW